MSETTTPSPHASELQLALPLPEVALLDRLYTVNQVAGFYPTSNAEINAAFGQLDSGSPKVETARHLDEIYKHQQKANTQDPEAAVRSVTNQYYSFARKARADLTALRSLESVCNDPDLYNRRISIVQAGGSYGIPQLARYMDIKTLATQQTARNLQFDPLDTGSPRRRDSYDLYTSAQPSRSVRQRLSMAEAMPVQNVAAIVPEAINCEANRFGFWVRKLEAATLYPRSRMVANNALTNLGVRPVR